MYGEKLAVAFYIPSVLDKTELQVVDALIGGMPAEGCSVTQMNPGCGTFSMHREPIVLAMAGKSYDIVRPYIDESGSRFYGAIELLTKAGVVNVGVRGHIFGQVEGGKKHSRQFNVTEAALGAPMRWIRGLLDAPFREVVESSTGSTSEGDPSTSAASPSASSPETSTPSSSSEGEEAASQRRTRRGG